MTRSISLWLPRSVTLLLGISLLHCSDGPTAPRPVASVTVEPGVGTLVVGGSVQLTATALDAGGAVLPGRVVTWTTSDGGVATVSSTGLVTGASDGSATVTASSETKSGTAAMTVLTVVFASVAAGSLHTCGVAAGGQALCWGSNGYGQLGNGD